MPALLGLNQTKTAIDAPLEVTGGVALRALANLTAVRDGAVPRDRVA